VSFLPTSAGDQYEYRLGSAGAWTPLGGNTAFQVAAGSIVSLRAVDLAGNPGPITQASPAVTTPAVSQPAPVVAAPQKLTPRQKLLAKLQAQKAARLAARAKALAAAQAKAQARALAKANAKAKAKR
jgi:hypothetical protein